MPQPSRQTGRIQRCARLRVMTDINWLRWVVAGTLICVAGASSCSGHEFTTTSNDSAGNGAGGTSSGGTGGSGATGGQGGGAGTSGKGGAAGVAGHPNGGAPSDSGADGAGAASGSDGGGTDVISTDGVAPICKRNIDCQKGEYCAKPSCDPSTMGHCVARPQACKDLEAPVCGCDENKSFVSFWNDCIRAQAGVPSSTDGECGGNTVAKCGGMAGLICPAYAKCATVFADPTMCKSTDFMGVCWGIPPQCPRMVIGASFRFCDSPSSPCVAKCDAIAAQRPLFSDINCPK